MTHESPGGRPTHTSNTGAAAHIHPFGPHGRVSGGAPAVAGPVAQDHEDDAAEVADQHDPAGDRDLLTPPDLGEGVGARRDAHRVGVGAVGAQPVQLAVPDAHLVGQAGEGSAGSVPSPPARPSAANDGSPAVVAGRCPPFGCPFPFPHNVRIDGTDTKPSAMPEARPTRAREAASAQQAAPEAEHRPGANAGALLEHGAEHREVQRHLAYAQLRCDGAQFGDHELHGAVGCGAVTAHQVQGGAVLAPGHEGLEGEEPAVPVEGLGEEAVAVGGVAEAVQGHGEAAFGLGVAPGVGAFGELPHLVLAEGGVAADAAGDAGAADPVDGLAGDAHVAAVLVAVAAEEGADTRLLVVVQGGFEALGTEQGGGGVQQGERAEQAEEEVEGVRRAAVEAAGGYEAAADPVRGPGRPLAAGQAARERLHEGPADQDRRDQTGRQDGQGPAYGGAAGGGVELLAGVDQQDQGEAAHHEGGDGLRELADGHAEDAGQDEQAQVDDDQPPGDLLAGAGRGGEQEQEDRVGEVGADRDEPGSGPGDAARCAAAGSAPAGRRADRGRRRRRRSPGAPGKPCARWGGRIAPEVSSAVPGSAVALMLSTLKTPAPPRPASARAPCGTGAPGRRPPVPVPPGSRTWGFR
jgi:hypothetical protein